MNKKQSVILGIGFCVVLALAISCATLDSVVEAPPLIPGAKYVGNDSCAACHEQTAKDFQRTNHGLYFNKKGTADKGCESCHGPGSLHAEAPTDKSKILKGNAAMCFTCHQRVNAEFALQYHHPLTEGRMTCGDCHTVHAPAKAGLQQVSNETCFKCHQEIRGPWTIEHEPVERDGCTVCHNPHGSINTRLLLERDYNLCLKCHYSSQYQSIGHYAHRRAVNPATLDPSGRMTTCLGCHRAVHGSNSSKELRAQ